MLTHARAYAVVGLDAIPIEVETYVSERDGAGAFTIVGLPDKALQEARARIRSAAAAAGLLIHKAVILANLAPAEVRKEGAGFDLPIALAVMAGFGWVNQDTLGEVAAVADGREAAYVSRCAEYLATCTLFCWPTMASPAILGLGTASSRAHARARR